MNSLTILEAYIRCYPNMTLIAFFDIEVSTTSKQLLDIGCILSDESGFHKNQLKEFEKFIEKDEAKEKEVKIVPASGVS